MSSLHSRLQEQLDALDPALRARLAAAGFDAARLLALASELAEGDVIARRRARNTVKGDVSPPRPGEIVELPPVGSPPHGPQGLAANANPWPGAFNSRCAGASPRLKLLSSALAPRAFGGSLAERARGVGMTWLALS